MEKEQVMQHPLSNVSKFSIVLLRTTYIVVYYNTLHLLLVF